MSQTVTPAAPAGGDVRPAAEYTQEIRFAVVMYGGSSLAIYMNGVAQELLRLVRATAPSLKEDDDRVLRAHLPSSRLEGSTRVYRKLGQILARGEGAPASAAGIADGAPLRTRFVIDILTGTSAGGINAVYLAKALANDQPLGKLKELWVSEGDVGVLLNDAKSDEGLDLGGQNPPGSLLNSRRMYFKLLAALRGMDGDGPVADDEAESPLVDELDLFVTATDMNGRLLPLRLADGVAHERRHRNVFRFRYYTKEVGGAHRNDFLRAYNPFLAFASRCTSAHQAAFEVMRLVDIEPNEKKKKVLVEGEYGVKDEELKKFYEEYVSPAALAASTVDFPERSFSDGGVLDNSPFSYASDALPFRHADWPVDRKLIYIEPSPEHPEFDPEAAERPDFFTNVLMALSTLPRYQTIVEDLMRVLERNRLIERTNHILGGLENDLKWKREHWKDYEGPPRLKELIDDREKALRWAMDKRNDLSWGGYQRLRVADVTDDLTLLVARAAGFDEESDEFTAIRYLVREWRDDKYYDPLPAGEEEVRTRLADADAEPQVMFLLHFDMMWLVRRMKFVLTKINEISCFDERAWQVLEAAREKDDPELTTDEGSRREMREILLEFKREVAAAFTGLRVARRKLWARGEKNPFAPYIAALDIGAGELLELLGQPSDQARRDYANQNLLDKRIGEYPAMREDKAGERRRKKLEQLRALAESLTDEGGRKVLKGLLDDGGAPATRGKAVAAFTSAVKARLREATRRARADFACAIAPLDELEDGERERCGAARPAVETVAEKRLRKALWYYYRHFDEYDQVAYPILHATDAGEELDPVEVFRISPEDATFLIDEKDRRKRGDSRNQKLAGTTLGHFGAFFEERFRHNDIMWGRLDAAERVVCALLPNPAHKALREELIYEAHREILAEEALARLSKEEREKLKGVIGSGLDGAGGAGLAAKLAGADIHPSLRSFFNSFVGGETTAEKIEKFRKDFARDFDEKYEDERAFRPRATVENAGRASRVFGRMVEGIADSHRRRGNKLVLWLTRLTRWTWGLAEVAVPDTIPNLFAHHLLRVLYLFEVALIVLGVLFASKPVQNLGLGLLAVTGFLHILLLVVSDFIRAGDEAAAGGKGAAAKGDAAKRKKSRRRRIVWRVAWLVVGIAALALALRFTNQLWLPRLLRFLINLLTGWLEGLKS